MPLSICSGCGRRHSEAPPYEVLNDYAYLCADCVRQQVPSVSTLDIPPLDYKPFDPDRWQTADGLTPLEGVSDVTNGWRADCGERMLRPWTAWPRSMPLDEDIIGDAVSYLLHLCHREGFDPGEVLATAWSHFINER